MGVRDFSYHGWKNVYTSLYPGFLTSVVVDKAGIVYAVGYNSDTLGGTPNLSLIRSTDDGNNWSRFIIFSGNPAYNRSDCVVDNSGNIYVSVETLNGVYRSRDKGVSWQFLSSNFAETFSPYCLAMDNLSGVLYAGGYGITAGFSGSIYSCSINDNSLSRIDSFRSQSLGGNTCVMAMSMYESTLYALYADVQYSSNNFFIRRSNNKGVSGSYSTVYETTQGNSFTNGPYGPFLVALSSSVFFTQGAGFYPAMNVMRSTTGNSGTYSVYISGSQYAKKITNGNGSVFFTCLAANERKNIMYIAKTEQDPFSVATTGAFDYTSISNPSFYPTSSVASANQLDLNARIFDAFIKDDGTIYTVGAINAHTPSNLGWIIDGSSIIRKGKLSSNSASIGPVQFATSYGYAGTELSGNITDVFALSNVSEFPHSNGIFQMKNIILGTQSSGKVGRGEDSIIQVKHIGSTVKIMWPRQENGDSSLVGYGDLSIGQSIGKLTTVFDPGDFIDVTEFDHMSLYCYLQKRTSGSRDDIVIQVERKPIRDIGFSTDQSVTYSQSGSVTEARLQDINYVKSINYGDLSLKEIAWPVDIPLTNTKQVRISCKFKNGQVADENKNFIVYGRFIKSSKDTNET